MSKPVAIGAVEAGTSVLELRRADQPVAFNEIEKRSVVELVKGAQVAVLEHAQTRATALAGNERDQVRLRSLARAASVAEGQMQQISLLFAKAVGEGNLQTAKELERIVRGTTRRYTWLIEQLRAESYGTRPGTVVMVGAGGVNVEVGAEP